MFQTFTENYVAGALVCKLVKCQTYILNKSEVNAMPASRLTSSLVLTESDLA